jgi:hypothetical protein
MGREINRRKEWFEELWDSEIQRSYKVEVPDPSQSWSDVAKKISRERVRRVRMHRIQLLTAVVASIVIGAVIFGTPQTSKALNPVTRFISNLKGDVISIFYGTEDAGSLEAKTKPPSDDGAIVTQRVSERGTDIANAETVQTVNEAKLKAPFPILEPHVLPGTFKLNNVTIYFGADKAAQQVKLLYSDGHKNIKVTTVKIPPGTTTNLSSGQGGYIFKKTKVHDKEAILSSYDKDAAVLNWIDTETKIEIKGAISEADIVKMAESMK